MALEPNFRWLNDLDPANPADTDPVSEGDDHLRGIKNAVLGNLAGDGDQAQLVVAGESVLTATPTSATVIATNSPTQAALLLLEDGGGETGRLQKTQTSGLLTMRNSQAGAGLTLEVRNGDDDANLVVLNAEAGGKVALSFNGVETFETDVQGARIKADSGAGLLEIVAEDGSFGRLQKNAGASFNFRNGQPGATVGMQARDLADDAYVNVFAGSAAGPQAIFHNGFERFVTAGDGADLVSGSNTRLGIKRVEGGVDTGGGNLFATTDNFLLRAIEGAEIQLQRDNGQTVARSQDDSSIQLLFGSSVRFQTDSVGVSVRGGAASRVSFLDNGGALGAYAQIVDGGAFTLDQRQTANFDILLGGTITARADIGAKTWREYSNGTQMTQTATVSQRATTNSGLYVTDANGTLRPVGFNILVQEDVNVATYTVAQDDSGKRLRLRAGNGNVNFGTISMSIGGTVVITNSDAADPVNLNSTGTMSWYSGAGRVDGPTRRLARGGVCTIVKVASTDFEIWGTGIS